MFMVKCSLLGNFSSYIKQFAGIGRFDKHFDLYFYLFFIFVFLYF